MQKLSRVNKGYKYLLTVIDTFSKSAWVQPLKEKTSSKMVKVFKTILKRASSRQPIRLQTDLKEKNFTMLNFANLSKIAVYITRLWNVFIVRKHFAGFGKGLQQFLAQQYRQSARECRQKRRTQNMDQTVQIETEQAQAQF